jgi:hypothetical protein
LEERIYNTIIYSNPPAAIVNIKGQILGQTPVEYSFKKQDLPFDVIVRQEGYLPYSTRIDETVEATSRINAELAKGGKISVNATPECRIFRDGKLLASTPYTSPLMRLGTYALELRRPGYRTVSRSVELTESRPVVQISENLEQLFGQVKLSVKPLGTTVFIDGKPIDSRIAQNLKLAHGQHRLELKKPGYFAVKKDLDIHSENIRSESFVLQPKSTFAAVALSTAVPGFGQMYYGKVGSGLALTGITAGLAYCVYHFNNEFVSSWDQFNIDLENYRNATTAAEIERTKKIKNESYETAIMNRNITLGSMGALGAVWLYNIWSAGHNFKGIPKRVALRSGGQSIIELSYKF